MLPILSPILPISRDKKDDYWLAFAQDYALDFLVTGDKDLLVLGIWQQTRIVNFREFVNELAKLNVH